MIDIFVLVSVSYTHLDVYKRQMQERMEAQLLAVPEGKVTTAASPIDNPDAAYLAATTKIDITDLPFASSHESITDGTLTVTFSEPVVKLGPVPEGWSTWSAPPFSEDPNPFVLSLSLIHI